MNRMLRANYITSILNDIFTGLDNLTTLFVTCTRWAQCLCFILLSRAGTWRTTKWCQFPVAPLLDLAAWPHCLSLRLVSHRICALLERHRQESRWQFNHIDFRRLFHWTRQLDHTVGFLLAKRLFLLDPSAINNRYMDKNRITSIENGSFTGLGSLTYLFVTCTLRKRFSCCIRVPSTGTWIAT